jgi:hypothetical protein
MRHARYLSPAENAALSRVFYDDAFIEGMGRVRGIADHVETGETVLRHTDGSAFTITAATSSAVLFASRLVYLTDKEGVPNRRITLNSSPKQNVALEKRSRGLKDRRQIAAQYPDNGRDHG